MSAAGPPPAVSVVIPTRDRWPLLRRALRTALAQEGVATEVIVVDDGSTDGTPERLREAAPPSVRVIACSRSGGVARARNAAIREARGAWVAFLDDDDMWAPEKLRLQLASAAPDVALVYTGAVLVDGEARMIAPRRTPPAEELEPGLYEANLVGTPSSVMARADALRRVGGFDEGLGVLADWDLWIRLAAEGRAAVRPEPLVAYTVHHGSMHLGDPAALRRELRAMRRKHREACEARGVELGGLAFSRWLVRRYRDAGMRREAARLYLAIGLRQGAPRDVARAFGMLLGEGAMRLGGRPAPAASGPPDAPEPGWLAAVRQGGEEDGGLG